MDAAYIATPRLRLVPNTPAGVRAQIEAMDAAGRAQLSADWLAQLQTATTGDSWVLGFTLVHQQSDAVVGTCGFKGPPDGDGVVEIAYGIAPEEQNRGYAAEAAAALVRFAFDSGRVRLVRAHTFANTNASGRVLMKCGFTSAGQIFDPEDGWVWRWETTARSEA